MQKVIVFDFDGVIVNSMEMIYGIYGEFAKRFNAKPIESLEKFQDLFDGHWKNQLRYMGLDPEDPEVFKKTHKVFMELHDKQLKDIKLFPGIFEVLAEVKKRGYITGLVSSNYRRAITHILENVGMLEFFDTVVAFEDATKVKPDPEPLLVCMKRLERQPAEAIYVGDAIGDIKAARAAGFGKVISTTYGWNRKDQLEPHNPDGFIDKPEDLLKHLE